MVAAGLPPTDTQRMDWAFPASRLASPIPTILTSAGGKFSLSLTVLDTGRVWLLFWARQVKLDLVSLSPTSCRSIVLVTRSPCCSELASTSRPSLYQARLGAGEPEERQVRLTVSPWGEIVRPGSR